MIIDPKWIDVDLSDHPDDVGDGWIEQTGDDFPHEPSFVAQPHYADANWRR